MFNLEIGMQYKFFAIVLINPVHTKKLSYINVFGSCFTYSGYRKAGKSWPPTLRP